MKFQNFPFLSRVFALLSAAFTFFAVPTQAQVPVDGTYNFFSDTIYDGSITPLRQQVGSETIWRIADGATVVVTSNTIIGNTGGGIFGQGVVNTIRIEPLGTTGRVVFENNSAQAEGSVFNLGMSGANLILNNVSFINNTAQRVNVGAIHGGGAIRGASASEMTMSNVLFERNSGRYGGAIYTAGNISVTSGTFTGNFAHGWNVEGSSLMGNANSGYGGVIATNIGSMRIGIFRNSQFNNNWARRAGGVASTRTRYSFEFHDTVDMSGNFASWGGAIADHSNTVESTEGVFFIYSGTAATNTFVYSGNKAKGADLDLDDVPYGEATSSGTFIPVARAGGFYISMPHPATAGSGAKTRLSFEIADGVTVQIGQAGNPLAWDSIATQDASGTNALLNLTGTGAGRLILHADNSYFQGTVTVGTGALLLGNQNASLGGVINVASGATLGGSGTLITHRQNNSVFEGRTSLNLAGGATLKLGAETAAVAETLYVTGSVTAGNNVIFSHDVFSGGSASKLIAETISLTGSASINLDMLATGTFSLLEWTGTNGLWSGSNVISESNFGDYFSLTVSGVAESPRTDAALFYKESENTIGVALTTIYNLTMKWTGADGAIWGVSGAGRQSNWADSGGSEEAVFFSADRVVFDGVADAANPANRAITLASAGVIVSDMEVTGGARYEFQGSGGISASLDASGNPAFARTAKLYKSGEGELVFANTGANNFEGGIDISGGMITFDRASQLGSGTGGITFSDSGTLRSAGTVNGTLSERLTIAAGKTAEIKTDSGELSYGGSLAAAGAGAVLRKTGGGAMLLTGNNAANTAAVVVDEGRMTLAGATAAIGGNITVNSGAVLGGIGSAGNGGGLAIASGGIIEAGLGSAQSGTLTVHNLTMTGGAVFKFDLFATADGAYRKSDRINELGTSAISGNNTIDLTSFATGTFNLGNITDLAAGTNITLGSMALPSGGRISTALAGIAGVLELTVTSDQSRAMTWTGNGGATWNLAGANWTDNASVNQYSYGDRVLFDGSTGAASRDINIGGDEVRVADITVSGDADHAFTGGAIHAGADNVQHNGIADASGKLIKTGAGTLTFANEKNTFLGGVDLDAGVLAIGSGDHIATAASTGITFTGDATLRATADLAINDDILIVADKSAVFDSAGHGMTLAGSLTGAAGAALAKTGEGVVAIESDMSGFSGTLSVRNGVLRAGAADVFTAATDASIVVDAGATLDLAGHNQTLTKLQGPGTVELGDATLTMNIGAPGAEFTGGFEGEGSVVKTGAGKWTLSGASNHTGGIVLQGGEIGLVNNTALGAGTLTSAIPTGRLSIDADGLDIANAISVSTGTLVIATNGNAVEFSGGISGANVVLDGAGTVTFSGTNAYNRMAVNTPLAIARRAESAAGTVAIADGSTFEFRGVGSGQVNAMFTGDRVLFTDSTLTLNRASTLKTFEIGAGSRVTASDVGAIGGATAHVIVRDGGALGTTVQGILADNVSVDGGALVFGSVPFGSTFRISSLALSGTLSFANGGEVRLGNRLHTGVHTAAVAYGGITGVPEYSANQDGMFMAIDIVDGNLLRITAYDMALEPGKDIAAGIDAMRSSLDAVYSHLGDEFLSPLSSSGVHSPEKAIWARVIGTFAEHESNHEYLGYKDNTFAVVLGYDWISGKNLMIGTFLGYTNTRLETHNGANTDIGMPILGIYAGKRWGDYFATANFAWGVGDADTKRVEPLGGRITGSYDTDSLGLGVAVGRVFTFGKGDFRPSVGIDYTKLSISDYSETGPGAVRLGKMNTDMLQAVVRIDGSRDINLPRKIPGKIDLGLGLRQNLIHDRTNIHATLVDYPENGPLPIRGDKYDTSTIIARFGLRAMLTKTTLVAVAYEYNYIPFGNHRNATRRDTFMATVRQSW